jgi:hypothetical protein
VSTYKIHIDSDITEEKLQKGLFIFMFRASKIPPHIGIITNGMLYDITSVGPNIDLPVSNFYQTVLRRKTEVVFIELEQPIGISLSQIITKKVREYWKVTMNTSCLNPIKDFINEVYSIEVSDSKFIFELLPILFEKNLIKGASQLNLSSKIVFNYLELQKYTEKDIENCIEALSRKEKITC